MEQQLLQKKIMRRVRTIHSLRKFINAYTLKCGLLLALGAGAPLFISVGNILANMPKGFNLAEQFFFHAYAFSHTEFTVQALAIGMLLIILWILKDIVRHIVHTLSAKHAFAQA